jgi:hypothetical protein
MYHSLEVIVRFAKIVDRSREQDNPAESLQTGRHVEAERLQLLVACSINHLLSSATHVG